MIQATLFQIDDYGPWTTTPAPRREMDLQTLQARLYADVAGFVGDRDGYAFYARGDNVIAVTNGIDRDAHERFLASVGNRYPVTVSAGVGGGETPRDALARATEALQAAGSAQDPDRRAVCRGEAVADPGSFDVAHFDVVDATGRYTDVRDAFGAYRAISRAYDALADRLYRTHDALAFFVGGDNVIGVCPELDRATYEAVLDAVADEADVDLRVGVGAGETAAVAGMAAKHGLERARERDLRVVLPADRDGAVPAAPVQDPSGGP